MQEKLDEFNSLDEFSNNGGCQCLSRHELVQLIYSLEEALAKIKRTLKDREKYV